MILKDYIKSLSIRETLSKTTKSAYYTFKSGFTVRISDHDSTHFGWNLNIMTSLNNSDVYFLQIRPHTPYLSFTSLDQVKGFIAAQAIVYEVNKADNEVKKRKKERQAHIAEVSEAEKLRRKLQSKRDKAANAAKKAANK